MFTLSTVVTLLAAAGSAFAAPITLGGSAVFDLNDLGVKFDKRGKSMPTLTLPYGTWQAAKYDSNGDVCRPPPELPLPSRRFITDLFFFF